MSGRLMIRGIVRQADDAQRAESFIVATNNFPAARQHFRISAKLRKADRSSQIGSIMLIPRLYNIICPGSQAVFVKGIYSLTVQAE